MKFLSLIGACALALCAFSVSAQAPGAGGNWGADRHIARGMTCQNCHGQNNAVEFPSIEQCQQCHVPEQVAQKTAGVQPQNPHQSPHYGNTLDCVQCHMQHEQPVNYCAQCHDFDFHVK